MSDKTSTEDEDISPEDEDISPEAERVEECLHRMGVVATVDEIETVNFKMGTFRACGECFPIQPGYKSEFRAAMIAYLKSKNINYLAAEIEGQKETSIMPENTVSRLVALEVDHEQVEHVETTSTRTVRGKAHPMTKTTLSPRMATTPPGAWDLHALYNGAKVMLPCAAEYPLCMSAFGHQATSPLPPFRTMTGVDVALLVSHRLQGHASFRAVLFGGEVRGR